MDFYEKRRKGAELVSRLVREKKKDDDIIKEVIKAFGLSERTIVRFIELER